MLDFKDIPQFTREAGYAVDVGWDYIPTYYANSVMDYALNVSPDFQRGYVWTPEQKVRYVEFILQGGQTGKDIYCNCPKWSDGGREDYVLVDGKQRLDAVLGWLNNEFPIFGGHYRRDITGWLRTRASFKWHVNDLKSRDEVLQWYVDLNAGGTIHSPEEIDRVRALKGQGGFVRPTLEETVALANLDRQVLQDAIKKEAEFQARSQASRDEAQAREAAAPKRKGRRRS
jgi:uncharacterized protein DUF262